MENINSDVSVELLLNMHKTQKQRQKILDKHISKEFTEMKEKRCSHELSTPELGEECIGLMKRDADNFSHLSLMKKVKKKMSEKTGKQIYAWVSINEAT